jgi:nitrate reductase delta subunit
MKSFTFFLKKMKGLSLAQREELHTRTLDLNPLAAPYIGYQIWGESYQRGAFMSRLNQEFVKHGIDKEGELPDHLIPILRYLTITNEPIPELSKVLPQALKAMRIKLKKAESDNPYLHLLKAVENTFSMN